MVGTAQVDNFSVFIKKVGYSVGVESLLSRAKDFAERYAAVPSFRDADWTWLVQKKWNLKTANVGDVFGALGIAKVRNREVYPGPIGETLGITRKLLDDSEFDRACLFILALALTRSDGDIFLNALHSRFEKDVISRSLTAMVREKREAMFKIFKTTRDREIVARAISIDRQKTNKGGGASGGLEGITKGAPLSARTQGLGLPQAMDVHHIEKPSDDYLHKITVSRKGWAESLGLFDGSDLTNLGVTFLSKLSRAGLSCQDGTFRVWPTAVEIEENQFDLRGFSSLGVLSTHQFQRAIFSALGGGAETAPVPSSSDIEAVSSQLIEIYRCYRELSQHRAMIRNEVPGFVSMATILATSFARGRDSVDLEEVLRSPLLPRAGITVRPSRTIELAITVRANGNLST